ncbi:MAG: glycoside hydrolase family 3 C-terminal domain-containing protein, partial [Clostridiales bacterium]|nr:glycoside hydrolase family 3 C-terminal domain-containing protein [Clostridiales bacterium]
MNSKDLVSRMTLEEKASLCSGKDFWHLKGVERLGLSSVMVTDGPHGLRKQAGESDHLGINDSVKATCFPTASATACSFDPELMREIGAALGEECRQEDVAVILGPGANIKRSPLCGRNFEYISEDPYVTGEMAAALISGIQSQGIGTSMKHYAANSQETRRMSTDSVVDERALREIYLTGFETAVKKAQPWTLMCAYNKLDGTYLSNNKRLLTDILREEWGFEGLVMTDWGAMDDRVKGVEAGLDLEMPASGGFTDTQIVEAVRAGKLSEAALDRAVERITALILRCQEGRQAGYRYDRDAHHALARRAAAQSTVLLKNEGGLLPLAGNARIAVIGQFAKTPRYQGAGSSKIEPTRLDNAWDALAQTALEAEYAPGYNLGKERQDAAALRAGACKAARDKDVVVLFAGLPDAYESEGFDRDTLEMPQEHVDLIEAVAAENPNVVVVLQCGAPVEMDWADRVKGIVLSYLGGQAGGSGCVDVLTGKVNPGGKLAETFPYHLSDTPSFRYFPGYSKSVEYRESLYVGYRYYDAADKAVRYPFGYGLSYTTFEYSNLKLGAAEYEPGGGTLAVSFTVTNTGTVPGAEVAQIYVRLEKSRIFRAKRELKGFQVV